METRYSRRNSSSGVYWATDASVVLLQCEAVLAFTGTPTRPRVFFAPPDNDRPLRPGTNVCDKLAGLGLRIGLAVWQNRHTALIPS